MSKDTLNDGSSAKNVQGCCWNHLNLDISGPIHWSFNIFEGAEHAMMLFLKGSIKVLEGPTKAVCGNGGFRVLEQQSIDKEHRQLMVIFRWIPHLECWYLCHTVPVGSHLFCRTAYDLLVCNPHSRVITSNWPYFVTTP